jgi:hypothetical protein
MAKSVVKKVQCVDLTVLPQPVSAVLWLVVYSPFSPSGSLSSLALRLPMLSFPGPFFVSWEPKFILDGFLPTLPLLLLLFPTLLG